MLVATELYLFRGDAQVKDLDIDKKKRTANSKFIDTAISMGLQEFIVVEPQTQLPQRGIVICD